jgi:hypothetical protein
VSNECPWEAGETLRREIKPTNRANAIVSVNKTVENRRKFDGFWQMPKIWQFSASRRLPTGGGLDLNGYAFGSFKKKPF